MPVGDEEVAGKGQGRQGGQKDLRKSLFREPKGKYLGKVSRERIK